MLNTIIDGLNLGLIVDEEVNGQENSTATGDGTDEDGLTFPPSMNWTPGGTVNIPFGITNTTGEPAELEIWIDWNGDGDFNDPNEMIADLTDDASGDFGQNGLLTINIPSDAVLDQPLGIRARLSSEDNMTPYGPVDSGEVEDYLVTMSCEKNICLPVQVTIKRGTRE